MKKHITLIFTKEGVFASLIKDIITFSTIIGSFYLNHKFIDSNNWVDFLLFIITSFSLFGVLAKINFFNSVKKYQFSEIKEAIEFLKSKEEEKNG
jgi:hypothetical protein